MFGEDDYDGGGGGGGGGGGAGGGDDDGGAYMRAREPLRAPAAWRAPAQANANNIQASANVNAAAHQHAGPRAEEPLPALNRIYSGKVARLAPYGAFVALDGFHRHGLVHVSQLTETRVADPAEVVAIGDAVFVKGHCAGRRAAENQP